MSYNKDFLNQVGAGLESEAPGVVPLDKTLKPFGWKAPGMTLIQNSMNSANNTATNSVFSCKLFYY